MATTVINRAMYTNIGGGLKTLTSLYMNSGGSRKTTSSAFANINGSRKQIFPMLYVWQKYNVNAYEFICTEVEPSYNKLGSTAQYLALNISISTHPELSWDGWYGYHLHCEAEAVYTKDELLGQRIYGPMYFDFSDFQGYYTNSVYYIPEGDFINIIDQNGYSVQTGNAIEYWKMEECDYTRGSYLGKVTSTVSSNYPIDGVSGNYWYVYQGQG